MIIEISNTNSNEKICTRCSKKQISVVLVVIIPNMNTPLANKCSEKCKNKRENIQKEMDMISRKKAKLESNLNAPVPSISIMCSRQILIPNKLIFPIPRTLS